VAKKQDYVDQHLEMTPVPYTDGLYATFRPDHDPLM